MCQLQKMLCQLLLVQLAENTDTYDCLYRNHTIYTSIQERFDKQSRQTVHYKCKLTEKMKAVWKGKKAKTRANNNNNDRLTAFDPGQPG